MNGLIAAAVLSAAAVTGPGFISTLRQEAPPRPFTGKNATLPGKTPQARKVLETGWAYQYQLREAHLESGYNGHVFFGTVLFLNADGTYEFLYNAHWNLRQRTLPVPVIGGLPGFNNALSDGVGVQERGKYSLSGDILLLEPEKVERVELKDNKTSEPQLLANKNRAYVVSIDQRNLHIAGRCASYQVDPVCQKARDITYKLTAQVGRKWLERR